MVPAIRALVDERPVNGKFYSSLVSATIRDESGQDSDKVTLVFDYGNYHISPPGKGSIIQPLFGYVGAGMTSMGSFEIDTITAEGGEDGMFLTVSGHAASFLKKMKQKSSEHFDDTTLGKMLQKVFGDAGGSIQVAGELASKKIEYEAKFDQSPYDFATRLADKHNAIFKPGGGKNIFVPRGSQNMLSGGVMSIIVIRRSECADWSIQTKPRPQYSEVQTKYYDPDKALTKIEKHKIGGSGPIRTIKHHAKNQDEAKAHSKSEAARLNRDRGTGHFTQYGRMDASAEADVIASGFGPIENGLWRAAAVEHKLDDSGFMTTIEVESPETPK